VGKHTTEQSRTARRTMTTLGVAGLIAGVSLFLGVGSAAAGTTTASKCSGTVSGEMGDSVKLKSDAVQDFVVESVEGGFDFPLLPITKSNQTKLREMFEAGKFNPISLTTVPKAASGTLSDEKIALAVVKKIESTDDGKQILSENDNRDNVLKAVESNCSDLTVKATNYVAPTTQPPSTQPGSGSGGQPAPGSSNSTAPTLGRSAYNLNTLPFDYGSGDARAPRRNYGGLPFALPGYGSGSDRVANPYATPDFGTLGGNGQTSDAQVSNAGNAEAVQAASPHHEAIQLPMLMAVVSLACVAAALVRTWVLRRL
jgi:hypothetical protein